MLDPLSLLPLCYRLCLRGLDMRKRRLGLRSIDLGRCGRER